MPLPFPPPLPSYPLPYPLLPIFLSQYLIHLVILEEMARCQYLFFCNVPDTLIIKKKTVISKTIILVVYLVLIILLFLFEKFVSESTQYLSVSKIVFVLFVIE